MGGIDQNWPRRLIESKQIGNGHSRPQTRQMGGRDEGSHHLDHQYHYHFHHQHQHHHHQITTTMLSKIFTVSYKTKFYLKRTAQVMTVVMGIGYFSYWLVERNRLPDDHPDNPLLKLVPPGSETEARLKLQQEAWIDSLFADIPVEERQRLMRKYGKEYHVPGTAPVSSKNAEEGAALHHEGVRYRRTTVIRKIED
eukprot:TRINITY_DN397_c0_g2_i1.p2 TRINITY_DN397_c0_g2~~TRINITY_DN397_c0_g2_i1.p2  ORF type:complete len:196 (+),score=37.54 TRINITY_DN397_c0_g2_i1:484-1071(+)